MWEFGYECFSQSPDGEGGPLANLVSPSWSSCTTAPCDGTHCDICVLHKPSPAKEMTVDEISKALGYKVKVVGSEKADD